MNWQLHVELAGRSSQQLDYGDEDIGATLSRVYQVCNEPPMLRDQLVILMIGKHPRNSSCRSRF